MKPNLIKKQISQAIVTNKVNFENFQIILCNIQTKKIKNTVKQEKNLILERINNNNTKFLQKNKVSKAIVKQNNKSQTNVKNFAIGSTDLHLYKNKTTITHFLEQETEKQNSLSFIKLNNFIFQMPQDNFTLWFFTTMKLKESLASIALLPIKALAKLENSRSIFEKKNTESNNLQ